MHMRDGLIRLCTIFPWTAGLNTPAGDVNGKHHVNMLQCMRDRVHIENKKKHLLLSSHEASVALLDEEGLRGAIPGLEAFQVHYLGSLALL